MSTDSLIASVSPFFVVDSLSESLDFYNNRLGFLTDFVIPEDDPFFAIVERGPAKILLKEIAPEIHPVPNHTRHEWARWDALVLTSDPDALFAEFSSHGVHIHDPLTDTDDGLRAFEIQDNNGYVLCFGRPL